MSNRTEIERELIGSKGGLTKFPLRNKRGRNEPINQMGIKDKRDRTPKYTGPMDDALKAELRKERIAKANLEFEAIQSAPEDRMNIIKLLGGPSKLQPGGEDSSEQ